MVPVRRTGFKKPSFQGFELLVDIGMVDTGMRLVTSVKPFVFVGKPRLETFFLLHFASGQSVVTFNKALKCIVFQGPAMALKRGLVS